VRRYLEEIVGAGNFALADTLFVPEQAQRVRRMIGGLREVFPDFHVTVEEQIAEGDKVATRWTGRGTQQGQFGDFAPTGKPVTWREIYIMRLVDGKIVESVAETNRADVVQQLGGKVVPPEPTSS
jgi:predicted ester cyclase